MPSAQQLKNRETQILNSLIFPSDLESTELFYPEAIRFGIYERQSIDLKKVKEDALSTTPDDRTTQRAVKPSEKVDNRSFDDKLLGVGKKPSKESIQENNANVNQARTASGLDPAEEQNVLQTIGKGFASAGRQLQAPTPAELSKRHIRSIYLAMPNSLIYNEAVDWAGTDLGAVIGGVLSGNASGALSAGALASSGALLGGAAAGALGTGVAGAVLGAIIGASSSLGGAIESVSYTNLTLPTSDLV